MCTFRTDGHFVCKLFDLFTPFSIGLVYLMYRAFKVVIFFFFKLKLYAVNNIVIFFTWFDFLKNIIFECLSFIYSFIPSLISYSFIYSLIPKSTHSFIHTFIYAFEIRRKNSNIDIKHFLLPFSTRALIFFSRDFGSSATHRIRIHINDWLIDCRCVYINQWRHVRLTVSGTSSVSGRGRTQRIFSNICYRLLRC